MHCFVTDLRPSSTPPCSIQIDFYRDELIRHQCCLRRQREYYSEPAVASAEAALDRVIGQIEVLSAMRDADQRFSRPLRSFDALTGVSALSDPKKAH